MYLLLNKRFFVSFRVLKFYVFFFVHLFIITYKIKSKIGMCLNGELGPRIKPFPSTDFSK